jgi:hypothetical protein
MHISLLHVRDGISVRLYPCFFHNKCYHVITVHYARSCCHKCHIISKNGERKSSGSSNLCHHATDRRKLSELAPRSVRQVKLLNMIGARLLPRKIHSFRRRGLSLECSSDFGVISYLESRHGIFILPLCYV